MRRGFYVAVLLAGASPAALAQQADDAKPAKTVVVITASPIEGDPDRFATIVENVTRDDILAKGGDNLADALKDVPGVAGTQFAAGASRPVIRGMDANRVKVLEDSISSSDVSDIGPDHGVPIDPLSAQSIEVVRGAATLRYGSQAIGGVVNAINNRVPMTLPDKPITGEASANYSSVAQTGQGSLMLDGGAGPFAWHLDGFGRHSSDYDVKDGTQENSFFRGDGYSAGGSYFFGDDNASRTGLAVTHYDAKYGIPSDDTYIDMKQTKGMSKSSIALGDGLFQKLNVDIGYADYKHSEIDPETGEKLSTFINKEWDGRSELLLGAMGPLSASAVGVQVGDRKFSALGEGGDYLSPTHTQSYAGFYFAEAPLGDKVNLQAAARVEHVDIKGTPGDDIERDLDFTPVSGSAGILVSATDSLKLGLTFSSAARAPAVTELFARGGHDGPATYETGDPDLKIERSNSLEGTARVRLANIQIDGSVWGARFTNYIYGRLTGNLCDDGGDCVAPDVADEDHELKELFYDQADANFYGAEIKATADLLQAAGGTLQAKGLADYVRAKFTDGGGEVPRIQPWRVGGGMGWESDQIDASFLAIYVGKRDDLAVGETATKGYFTLDAHVDWRPTMLQGVSVILAAHNLTDSAQRNAVALNKDDVLLPGRDISLTLTKSF